ncbi:MAG: hypothetical protein HYX53_10460 [Chloroflexi bacterium]|nr:hypothetical protein [Chloroflexota bacterium]
MVYIADTNNHVVRDLDPRSGSLSTLTLTNTAAAPPGGGDDANMGVLLPRRGEARCFIHHGEMVAPLTAAAGGAAELQVSYELPVVPA